MTFVVASDVAFEQIVDAVEQDVGAVEHIEVVAQCEVIFVQPEKKIIFQLKTCRRYFSFIFRLHFIQKQNMYNNQTLRF